MKDDVNRFTNLGDTACPECLAPPGDQHDPECVLGNRNSVEDSEYTRRTIQKLGKNAAAKAELLTGMRELERELTAQGFPKAVIARALEDLRVSPAQRVKWDRAYTLVRAGLGIPIQTEAFTDAR